MVRHSKQRNIEENLNIFQLLCENLKSRVVAKVSVEAQCPSLQSKLVHME
jgi:hypothetical protein